MTHLNSDRLSEYFTKKIKNQYLLNIFKIRLMVDEFWS